MFPNANSVFSYLSVRVAWFMVQALLLSLFVLMLYGNLKHLAALEDASRLSGINQKEEEE
jgi:hypothetical protein